MKLQDINRKRLWILLTVLWCIGVVVYFYEPIKKENKYNNNKSSMIEKLAQKHTFDQCLSDNGTNYLNLVKNNSDRCKEQACENATGLWLFGCSSGLSYKLCIASSSEECKHIYFHTGQKESKYYDYKKAEIIKRSKSISYPQQLTALLLFFGIPLLFAVFPKIISVLIFLKKWLVSK
jgi:hypothetical protein